MKFFNLIIIEINIKNKKVFFVINILNKKIILPHFKTHIIIIFVRLYESLGKMYFFF